MKEPGLATLEAISTKIKPAFDTPEDLEWKDHPLEWIRSHPSARIGKIGRSFVQSLCEDYGLQVKKSGYSLIIKDKKIQVRFSTGWSGGGFKFEQLRFEGFDAVFCLSITPTRVYGWVIPKSVIFDPNGNLLKKDGLTIQHKGKGGSDTAWINVDVHSIPAWMAQHGDSLSVAMNHLTAVLI
jgi:hypothetical protein